MSYPLLGGDGATGSSPEELMSPREGGHAGGQLYYAVNAII